MKVRRYVCSGALVSLLHPLLRGSVAHRTVVFEPGRPIVEVVRKIREMAPGLVVHDFVEGFAFRPKPIRNFCVRHFFLHSKINIKVTIS